MQHVLPVLLAGLPLVSDNSEGPGIYRCLGTLLLSKEATTLAAFAPTILPLLVVLCSGEYSNEGDSGDRGAVSKATIR